MHTEVKLVGEPRSDLGSLACRKLRRTGRVPANLYGHKQDPEAISLGSDDVDALVRSGSKVLDLEIAGKTDKAILQGVQWDTFGTYVLHCDFLRVDPNERVHVEVPVELKGTAPGVLGGGVLEHTLRSLDIECLAYQMPDQIVVKIGSLDVGQAIHVSEVELPPGTKVLNDPELVVVRVTQLQAAEEAQEGGAPVQPELIGRKPAEGEES